MKNDTTELLIKILREHGTNIYKNTSKFKSILLDYGVSKKKINLLIEVTKAAYFNTFVEVLSKQTIEFEKVMLLNSVQDEYDFDEAYAIDGVKCWANSLLGVADAPDASKMKSAANAYYDASQVAASAAIEIENGTESKIVSEKPETSFEDILSILKNNYNDSDMFFTKIAKIAAEESLSKSNTSEIQEKAKNGNAQARFLLAQMYESGNGVIQSFREAIKWYKMAAMVGDVNAVYRLGQIYEQGKIVPKNLEESIRWYKIAKEKGHSDGERKLKKLKKEKSWFFNK